MRRTEPAFLDWLTRYALRAARDGLPAAGRQAIMDRANPRYVPRNYLVQEVIDRAEQGDPSGIPELLDVMRRPYEDQPGADRFDRRRPDWRATAPAVRCSRAAREARFASQIRLAGRQVLDFGVEPVRCRSIGHDSGHAKRGRPPGTRSPLTLVRFV
jgi:hypothetical protein